MNLYRAQGCDNRFFQGWWGSFESAENKPPEVAGSAALLTQGNNLPDTAWDNFTSDHLPGTLRQRTADN